MEERSAPPEQALLCEARNVPDEEIQRSRIVHELANQLMVVEGNLELIRSSLLRDGREEFRLERASKAIERCRILTELLCTLSNSSL